jgi:hypothetical protein
MFGDTCFLFLFIYLFAILGFELRASYLAGGTPWLEPHLQTIFALVILERVTFCPGWPGP